VQKGGVVLLKRVVCLLQGRAAKEAEEPSMCSPAKKTGLQGTIGGSSYGRSSLRKNARSNEAARTGARGGEGKQVRRGARRAKGQSALMGEA